MIVAPLVDVVSFGEAPSTKMELSRPSVGATGSYDARGQSQPSIRVAGIIAGGAAAHQGPVSKKVLFLFDECGIILGSAIKLRYPLTLFHKCTPWIHPREDPQRFSVSCSFSRNSCTAEIGIAKLTSWDYAGVAIRYEHIRRLYEGPKSKKRVLYGGGLQSGTCE